MSSFVVLASRHRGGESLFPLPTVLALDPGKTTGYCVFIGYTLHQSGQIDTSTITEGSKAILGLITGHKPNLVVVEDYRVYSWKAKQHSFSDLHTSRLIGSVETLCALNNLPEPVKQMAGTVKQFCSNERLEEWGFYVKGQPHARDAIRHACYYILFNKEEP